MNMTESETVELKAQVIPDLCKEIIAFANTKGGTLYIGVRDDGTIAGIDDPDHEIQKVNNMIKDSIRPDVSMFIHYEVQGIEEKKILMITIQKGTDRPYYLASKGMKPSGVYVRNGTSCDPTSELAIRKMIKDTDGDIFEGMRSLEQNLTFHAADSTFAKKGMAFDKAKMQSLGLIAEDGTYTNLALLLSDQNASTIKSASFSGKDKAIFQDRREFTGSLFQQMDDLYTWLDLQNKTKATFHGLYRTDTRDIPEEAIREALLNCLVHKDYALSTDTFINVYHDRMEFISAGGLANGYSLDDILLGLSVCRNPKLAALFYRLQLIEAYGTGIQKIMQAYVGQIIQPRIEVTPNAFKITLPNQNVAPDQPCSTIALSDYERTILSFLEEEETITRPEVDALLNTSQPTSSRILKQMIQDGSIKPEGRGKNRRYKKN